MKYLKKYKVFETPDAIMQMDPKYHYLKKVANWDDPDAYAFGIINGQMYLGAPAETHNEYTLRLRLQKKIESDYDKDVSGGRLRNKYPGRIWIKKKFISFWTYPKSGKELEEICHMLEHAFKEQYNYDIVIWDDPEFKIEVNESPTASVENNDDNFYGAWIKFKEENIKLIPLKEYKTSYDVPDKIIKQTHTSGNSHVRYLLNKSKRKRLTPDERARMTKNYKERGSQSRLKWDFAHKYENKINETPDFVVLKNGKRISFSDEDARAFGILKGKMIVGISPYDSHSDLVYIHGDPETINELDELYYDLESYDGISQVLMYPGRFWLNGKIITFYTYPENNAKLQEIIRMIETAYEKETGEKLVIWDDPEFKIEIILSYKDVVKDYREYLHYFTFAKFDISYVTVNIPLKEFKYSENITDDNIIAIEKAQAEILKYNVIYNRRRRPRPTPRKVVDNETELKWKFAHKYENKIFESPDRVITYDIEANPHILARHYDPDARVFGYTDDTLSDLLVGQAGEKHHDLVDLYQMRTGNYPDMKREGRVWLEKKIISFYDYPKDNKELEKIIHDIEKELRFNEDISINIWDDPKFRIEIPMDYEEMVTKKPGVKYGPNVFNSLIPLKSYKSDEQVNKDRIVRVVHTSPNSKFRNILKRANWKKLSDEERRVITKNYTKKGKPNYLKWKYAHKNEKRSND